ncbi:MAG TPA: heparinase II/III family protein [Kofleriaceae bacterium]|nr:heparinase II/III family protein [Kofleriaceae bacterium]
MAAALLFARRAQHEAARQTRRKVFSAALARRLVARIPREVDDEIIRLAESPRDGWPQLFPLPAADAFRAQHPASTRRIHEAAEVALSRQPWLLGAQVEPAAAGEGLLPWHRDTRGGYGWPRDVPGPLLGSVTGSDIKRPWELSRFQHLLPCALAYWLSGDERMVREIRDEVVDWWEHNPFGMGVNWACAMEVGIRALTWLFLLDVTFDSAELSQDLRSRWLRSIFQHGRFIRALPETSARVAGDHFVADQCCLVAIGAVFRNTPEGAEWLHEGLHALDADITDQIDRDGVYRGGSLLYAALMAEMYVFAIRAAQAVSVGVPAGLAERARRLVAFLAQCTPPDGRIPTVGDYDSCRLLPLDPGAPRRDRRFVAAVARAIGLDVPAPEPTAEAALWGAPGGEVATLTHGAAYRETGFYVLRSARLCAIVDGYQSFVRAPNGHRHESRLALVLADDRGDLLVDPGTASYTVDPFEALRFRAASSHNVIVPRGATQAVGARAGSLGREGRVVCVHYAAGDDREEVELAFDGYERAPFRTRWRRRVTIDRRRDLLAVVDDLAGETVCDAYWHLPPGEVEVGGDVAFFRAGATRLLAVAVDDAVWRVGQSEIAPDYGERAAAPVLMRELVVCGAYRAVTVFARALECLDDARAFGAELRSGPS